MGFTKLSQLGPAVTIFGSARFKSGEPYYELSRETGSAFAKAGFTVLPAVVLVLWKLQTEEQKKQVGQLMDSI